MQCSLPLQQPCAVTISPMDPTHQHTPYPLDEVQHLFFKRSQSQQDILGRTNNFPVTLPTPAELERLTQTTELQQPPMKEEASSGSVTTGRLPFPPVPKLEQLPSLPPAPTSVPSYPTTGSQVEQRAAK